jgi:hypothetical protein
VTIHPQVNPGFTLRQKPPFGVVDVFLSDKPPEHRLPQHADKRRQPFFPMRVSTSFSPAVTPRPSASTKPPSSVRVRSRSLLTKASAPPRSARIEAKFVSSQRKITHRSIQINIDHSAAPNEIIDCHHRASGLEPFRLDDFSAATRFRRLSGSATKLSPK